MNLMELKTRFYSGGTSKGDPLSLPFQLLKPASIPWLMAFFHLQSQHWIIPTSCSNVSFSEHQMVCLGIVCLGCGVKVKNMDCRTRQPVFKSISSTDVLCDQEQVTFSLCLWSCERESLWCCLHGVVTRIKWR